MLEPAATSVFILAAGRGERMRPLTDRLPKPMLPVAGMALIEHQIVRLREAGFRNLVINYAHLGQQIVDHLADGARLGVEIQYSDESAGALETAGGIVNALPLLSSDPFVTVNADVWTDFSYPRLLQPLGRAARLVMVDNPQHHPGGDFAAGADGLLSDATDSDRLTFSGIGLFRHAEFAELKPGFRRLREVLEPLIHAGQVEYVRHAGQWLDIGTPKRLEALRAQISSQVSPATPPR